MAVITHKFHSNVADGADTSLVRPSNWNDTHNFTEFSEYVLQPANDGATGTLISDPYVLGTNDETCVIVDASNLTENGIYVRLPDTLDPGTYRVVQKVSPPDRTYVIFDRTTMVGHGSYSVDANTALYNCGSKNGKIASFGIYVSNNTPIIRTIYPLSSFFWQDLHLKNLTTENYEEVGHVLTQTQYDYLYNESTPVINANGFNLPANQVFSIDGNDIRFKRVKTIATTPYQITSTDNEVLFILDWQTIGQNSNNTILYPTNVSQGWECTVLAVSALNTTYDATPYGIYMNLVNAMTHTISIDALTTLTMGTNNQWYGKIERFGTDAMAVELGSAASANTEDFETAGAVVNHANATAPPHMNFKLWHGVESYDGLAFDAANTTVTLANCTYWYSGNKVVGTGYSANLANASDRDHANATLANNTLYYIYFKDNSGKLYWSPTAWNLPTMVPIATVYWNGTNGAVIRETHGYNRDIAWHAWAHLTIGSRISASDFALSAPSSGSPTTISVAGGTIYDEDLATTSNTANNCRVWYQVSANTYTWVDSNSVYPTNVRFVDSANYTLTDVATNAYINIWVYAAPDIDRPIYTFVETKATGGYNTVANARAVNPPALNTLGLSPELKLLYRIIMKGDETWAETTDYRASASLPVGGSTSPTAASVTFAPAGNIVASSVQGALEELDTEKAPITQPVFTGVPAETSVSALGSVSGNQTLNLATNSVWSATCTGACEWNFTNPPVGAWSATLILTNGNAGAQTYKVANAAANAFWAGGAAGSNDTFSGAAAVDILQVFNPSGNTATVYLMIAGKDFKA